MTDSPTRAERRAQSKSRSRTWLIIGAVALVVVAVAAVALLLTNDSSSDHSTGKTASRTVANTKVTIAPGEVTADSAGAPVTVDATRASGVVTTIGDYVETAIVKPLRTGQPAGDLSGVFDTAALARATGVDRAALVDEGLPKVTGDLTVAAKPVAITGLGDQDGNLVAVTATVDLDISAPAAAKKAVPLHIVRTGSFVLTPDLGGTWKVSAYSMNVTRDGGGIDSPTTTVATTP